MTYSRFFLSDLQVHTPADAKQGYGDVGGREPNEEFAKTLVKAHADAGVRVMAVTDHNRVDWYPLLRQHGEDVGVWVFPGLEFSVNGCHLLVIWDRSDEGLALAERFVRFLWQPGEDRFEANGDPRPVTRGQVLELAEEAQRHNGLVLAPHSTAKGIGLFAKGVCRNSSEVAQSGLIAGFDVVGSQRADVLKNPRSEFGDRQPSWFISGDVRALGTVGQRAVYLKLGAEPTLEGLRQAFLMPDTRIRFPAALQDKWGHVAGVRFAESVQPTWPRVTKVEVHGGFHANLDVRFGAGLNAVIGGKGTGKSTLVEILRYVLEAGEPLHDDARGNLRQNFKANADAVVGFVDSNGDEYEVRRSGDGARARLLRAGRDTDVDVGRRVSVQVFGQRELQELGNRPDLLREFVATQAGGAWSDAASREEKLIQELRQLDSQLTSMEGSLAAIEHSESELRDVQDRLSVAEERGLADLITRSRQLASVDESVKSVQRWPSEISRAGDELEDILPGPRAAEHDDVPNGLNQLVADLETTIERIVDELRSSAHAASSGMDEFVAQWHEAHAEQRSAVQAALADAGIQDPGELESMQRRVAELQAGIHDAPDIRQSHASSAERRSEVINELGEARREKSRLIEDATRNLTARVGGRVRVITAPLGDKKPFVDALEEAVKGQGVRKDQLRKIADHPPLVIAEAARRGPGDVEQLGCSANTAAKLADLPPEILRSLEETDTPDLITVEMDLGSDSQEAWTDVVDVSPGQRATALLALVLASGDEPLLIDQPEDDLDNRYIYDEVVKVLGDVCQARQVIATTHNANIPVLGDAEYVLALDASAGRSSVLASGGLEDAVVAEASRTILEGGDEAFLARHRRYLAAAQPSSMTA